MEFFYVFREYILSNFIIKHLMIFTFKVELNYYIQFVIIQTCPQIVLFNGKWETKCFSL